MLTPAIWVAQRALQLPPQGGVQGTAQQRYPARSPAPVHAAPGAAPTLDIAYSVPLLMAVGPPATLLFMMISPLPLALSSGKAWRERSQADPTLTPIMVPKSSLLNWRVGVLMLIPTLLNRQSAGRQGLVT